MACSNDSKRITYKSVRPNPLFLQWLEELHERAVARGLHSQNALKEAIKSLKRYPIPIESADECAILKGFGKKLCTYLDRKLREHETCNSQTVACNNQNLVPASSAIIQNPTIVPSQVALTSSQPSKKKVTQKSGKHNKQYKPANRTGACAILLALFEHINSNPPNLSLAKEELIKKAQPLCDESFTRPKPDSHYTAWSSMSRLISKGLVASVRRKKAEYSLSDEGYLVASELHKDYKDKPTTVDLMGNDFASFETVPSTSASSQEIPTSLSSQDFSQKTSSSVEDVIDTIEICDDIIDMPAGTFEIVLLVDKQETIGAGRDNDPIVVQINKYQNFKHEFRHLKIGDFTWVARHKTSGQELVLPFIIERKRMDDLGSSIKDGRFHEQKFRLKKCGLPNVIYLIENYGKNKHVGLPLLSLMQAISNTRVQDGFKVHTTDSLAGSVRFLAIMTKRLTIEFKDKDLKGRSNESTSEYLMTFKYFNESSAKTKPLTVTEAFIKMLLQLKGMSVEKAVAITNAYKTPNLLIEKYEECNQKEGEMLLAKLKYDELSQNVGPSISKIMYKLFTAEQIE